MMKRHVILLIAVALVSCACARAGELIKTEYKTVEGKNLELHICNPQGHKSTDRRPAVIFFFGGGWARGNPSQFYPYITELARHGIVAISAEYRTSESHGGSPIDAVMDARSAMRYLREHADKLGIDADRIVAAGGSAGAHLAACTALATAPDAPTDSKDTSPRPQALLLLNPILSVGKNGFWHRKNTLQQRGRKTDTGHLLI